MEIKLPIRSKPAPANQRKCGRCTTCCTVLTIPELSKPRNTKCVNECATGCAIYSTRPQSCRNFKCSWISGDGLEEDRPDKLGIVFFYYPFRQLNLVILVCEQARPLAFMQPRVHALVNAKARNQLVLAINSQENQVWMLGPPRDLERAKRVIDQGGFTPDPVLCSPNSKIVAVANMGSVMPPSSPLPAVP